MAFAEEAVVVAGDEVGFDLAHGVEHDADDDQQGRAAEELGDHRGDLEGFVEEHGQDGDDGQEDGAGQGDAGHDAVEEFGGGFAGADAGDVAAVFLEVVGDLDGVELGGDPEVGEEEDHQGVEDEVAGGAIGELVLGEAFEALGGDDGDEALDEHQNGLGEDDGHDAGVVDAQGHGRALAAVGLAVDDALGVLDGDLALGLGDGYGPLPCYVPGFWPIC